jgi:hypothetical protein
VVDGIEGAVEPVLGAHAPTTGPTVGTLPQISSHPVEPMGSAPVAPEEPVLPPVTGAMPATGASSPVAALGTPRGTDSLATTIGLPPSERDFAATNTPARERPGAFAVPTKDASSAWGVRGPPAALAGLGALIAGASRAETLTGLPSGASGSAPNGGATPPLPAAPSSGGLGVGGGGLALGVLALLLALSPPGFRLLRHSPDILRPNSALVLAIERPG